MRVGVSLLTLVPGSVGGSETYVRELTRALAGVGEIEVTAFVPPVAADAGGPLRTTVVEEYGRGTSGPQRAAALVRALLRPGPLRRRYAGLDVVHYPLTVRVPQLEGVPTAITLHDLQHLDLRENFGRAQLRYRTVTYDRAAKSADAVIVPSEFVRERARNHLGLEPARVRVIPEGVDHAVFAPGLEEREPFLLYPARPWPHKNHRRLLEAFALLRQERPELSLVLTGGGLEALGQLGPGIVRRGLVSRDELVSLYRRASCLVFPSLYEGFGLPLLEAMACGCPVAASKAGAIPEICSDAAVVFDAQDPEAIAAGVEEAMARADELRDAGTKRAARFTWDACARAHVDVYRSLC